MQLTGNIFITGGAGFLGRGILQRAYDENWDARFTVFSRDETKHARLKVDFPHVRTIRGSVAGDIEHLTTAMQGHDIVIHAAATKIIPVAERNVLETIQDNIIGSSNVAYAACKAGVKRCLAIGTDKSAFPTNLYGATKMAMERIFQEAQTWNYDTNFHLVRYGNVLDSTASVLTLWERQLATQGQITLTDPDMTRFWLTIDQAVDLVLLALNADPATVIIPELPALCIGDLAKYFYPDAEWDVTGLRAGEKVHECLLTIDEARRALYDADNKVFVLLPSGYKTDDDRAMEYTSEFPVRWIGKDEFLEMMGK